MNFRIIALMVANNYKPEVHSGAFRCVCPTERTRGEGQYLAAFFVVGRDGH